MSVGGNIKRVLRRFGVEMKHLHFGLDLWLDLETLFAGRPPVEIFDVGANEGQTALRLVRLFPEARIHAFEPNPATLDSLRGAVKGHPRIVPEGLALGASEMRGQLQITGSSVNASLLRYDKPGGTDAVQSEATVEVATLDRFSAERGISPLDLLKIDTQGYDLEVIKGGAELLGAERIHALIVEVNFIQLYSGQSWFHEIYSFLHGHGLRLSGFYDVRYENEFFIQWADALFVLPSWAGQRPAGRSPW
jgi:FkbM family methyltransferase